MKKTAAFISFGRKCENSFICFWFPCPGDVALLPVLVRLIVAGAATNMISKPLCKDKEGDFIIFPQ